MNLRIFSAKFFRKKVNLGLLGSVGILGEILMDEVNLVGAQTTTKGDLLVEGPVQFWDLSMDEVNLVGAQATTKGDLLAGVPV